MELHPKDPRLFMHNQAKELGDEANVVPIQLASYVHVATVTLNPQSFPLFVLLQVN